MAKFRVTYEVITPESAEDWEAAERGFIISGGWHIDSDTANADTEGDYDMSLREALRYCCPQENAGGWFTEVDPQQDYATGTEEYRSLHPPNDITRASYRRLCRLFKVRSD